MSKEDRKLGRKRRKRQFRLIKGEGKGAARKAQPKSELSLTPPQRFELTLASFIKEYFALERQRPVDDRVTEEQVFVNMYRFTCGMAIALDVTHEQFLEGADGVYNEQLKLYEEKKNDGDEEA